MPGPGFPGGPVGGRTRPAGTPPESNGCWKPTGPDLTEPLLCFFFSLACSVQRCPLPTSLYSLPPPPPASASPSCPLPQTEAAGGARATITRAECLPIHPSPHKSATAGGKWNACKLCVYNLVTSQA